MKKIFALFLSLLLVVGCSKNKETSEVSKQKQNNDEKQISKLKVTVTTSFLEDMVNNLAKDFIDVVLVIPAGEDPHTYEAKPEDYNKFLNADMILYHGLHFEGKMIELLEKQNGVAVSEEFDKTRLLTMDDAGKTVTDPHFWFDVDLYKVACTKAAKALEEKIPAHKSEIESNLQDYLKKLDDLKEYASSRLSSIPKERRFLITPHDAFSYFARTYDIVVHAPQGVSTDSEVDNNAILETANFIVKNKIKAIFAESTTDPKRMEKLKESCASKGHDVKVVSGEGNELYSDSLAPKGQKGDNYIDMVKINVDLIVENLK